MASRTQDQSNLSEGPIIKSSAIFSLPRELRDMIYEYVASSTATLHIERDSVVSRGALSAVCRQLSHEYEAIYLDLAPKHALHVVIHCVDFEHRAALQVFTDIMNNTDGKPKTLRFNILLTNTFERNFCSLRVILTPLQSLPRDAHMKWERCEIEFNSKTFDVWYARQTMARVFSNKRHYKNARPWLMMEMAFHRALTRHDAAVAVHRTRKAGRKRTAKTQEGRGGGTKSRRAGRKGNLG
ncbi:hypothetical protein B0A50_08246 [Salinomyces thailandicus]|uniref:F-box domain-containing protein n=1 Tax=Salinomyces thailandicus TaxID=706561 RepID=A0A4U0TKB5_9PEZI|nr:hypothetical protein B0A50_08246 [Salinomyces thailandica]